MLFPHHSPNFSRINPNLLTSFSHSGPLCVSAQRLSHVISITPIVVVVDNPPVDAVSHLLVKLYRSCVLDSHKEVYKPCILTVADDF